MAIVKVTASNKAVQFIDDQGHVFQTSRLYMEQLLAGQNKYGFVLLNRMPWDVAEGRFKKSPMYDPKTGGKLEGIVDSEKNSTDALSDKSRATVKQAQAVQAAEEFRL